MTGSDITNHINIIILLLQDELSQRLARLRQV